MDGADLISRRWDDEYRRGRYGGERPIPFAGRIRQVLDGNAEVARGTGLYVGCGNGRNYLPLLESGLDLLGIDISQAAIDMLSKMPGTGGRLQCMDFADMHTGMRFDYIISIQAFQHGDRTLTAKYFERARRLLRRGGLLFLRVNSVSTDIILDHRTTETGTNGGITIRYTEGPKAGLDVHFYSLQELDGLCGGFEHVAPPYEDVTRRKAPLTGAWSQWELVLRRI